tara:strand:- start:534 stop:1295 length:762 start_codon:yes stop_codon:yes gene_type:complete
MNNEISLVDIILPNYNSAETLEETINSVVSQKFKNFKFYIIDDGSSDNSVDIIKKFKDDRIILVQLKKNKGVHFSRNLGIRFSNSKYISFIDSDDYWEKDKLNNQVNFMQKYNHNFTYTDYIPFSYNNGKKKFKNKINVNDSFNFSRFINDTSIAMSSVIIKREIINNIKFKKLKICEDYLFKCEILKKHKAYKCNGVLMYYRISRNSLQSNKFRNLYWVWKINKKFNKLKLLRNLISVISISLNSIKKYGFK